MEKVKNMEQILEKSKCTGCSACMNVCPKSCIEMVRDEEGFEYPVIDKEKCIDCKLCQKTCPINSGWKMENTYSEPEIYAGWSRDNAIRLESTSGGIFTELAKGFMAEGGYVCGARYTESFGVEHFIINDEEGLNLLRQSKYVQSHIGYIYRDIEKLLKEGKKVMFVGAPCEVAGLASSLRKTYDNLVLVDFVCRGTNSPKAYDSYISFIEKKYNSKIKRVWFKNKKYGWNRFATRIELENGKVYTKDRYSDCYMRGYLERNLFIRPSCEQCNFKEIPRKSDITLADFWGIGKYDRKMDTDQGTSLVFINTDKGKGCFNAILDNIVFEKEKLDYALEGNVCILNSVKINSRRKEFYKALDEKDFYEAIKPFLKRGKREKLSLMKKKIKRALKI